MSNPFSEDDYHDLLERETLLDDLEDSPGWQALKAEVSQVIAADTRRLLSGELTDTNEYLKVAWRIRGAESVLNFPQATRELVVEYRRMMAEREGGTDE